ncbi:MULTISPECIES: hypothetical protein [Nitrosomonas]|nr:MULTISPECIES: hypothetical protein [Nitrosomonas]UVS62387.1 hypothetical protein NX761_04430 [Nitrosomonas sp. PLL12]
MNASKNGTRINRTTSFAMFQAKEVIMATRKNATKNKNNRQLMA